MNVRALTAEALGTFILVGVGSMSAVAAAGSQLPGLLTVPFGFGLGLLAALAIAGHVSGGHFNPAVTLGALIDGRIDVVGAIGYAIAQIVGALAASFTILLIVNKSAVDQTRTGGNVGDPQAFGTEVILTAIFVAVILTVTRRQPSQALFIIPLTLMVIHFAAIPISGASVNPARSLAPAIVVGNYDKLWIYLAAPLVGAIVGWLIYRFLNPPDDMAGDLELDAEDLDDLDEARVDDLPAGSAG
jgi:aquaporin Z